MSAVRVFLGIQLLKYHCFNGGAGGQSQRYLYTEVYKTVEFGNRVYKK